jgi:hypothetical protein
MSTFLRSWPLGVNVIVEMFNAQLSHVQFEFDIKQLTSGLMTVFRGPHVINHICFVFTRWFDQRPEGKHLLMTRLRTTLSDFLKSFLGCDLQLPEIPFFFVDSPMWRTDSETASEFARLRQHIASLPALSTEDVADSIFPSYISEKQTRDGIEVKRSFINSCRIQEFQNQWPERRIDYNGNEGFTDWQASFTYTQRRHQKQKKETRKQCTKTWQVPICHMDHCGDLRCLGSPKPEPPGLIGHIIVREVEKQERIITTDRKASATGDP